MIFSRNVWALARGAITALCATLMLGGVAMAATLEFNQQGVSNFAAKGNLWGFSLTLNSAITTSTASTPATPKDGDLVHLKAIKLFSGGGGSVSSGSFATVNLVLYSDASGTNEVLRSSNSIRTDGAAARGTVYEFQFADGAQLNKTQTYYAFFKSANGSKYRARVELNSSPAGVAGTTLLDQAGNSFAAGTHSPRFIALANAVPFNTDAQPVVSQQAPEYNYVVVLAGQSNMVGYGEVLADANGLDAPHARVLQVSRSPGQPKAVVAAHHSLDHVQDMKGSGYTRATNHPQVRNGNYAWPKFGGTVGAGQWIGKNLLAHMPANAGVLLVPAARGSSGFNGGTDNAYTVGSTVPYVDAGSGGSSTGTWSRWGVSNGHGSNEDRKTGLYLDMRERIKWALDQNPKNILVGVVWMQGEADLSDPETHKTRFEAQVQELGVDLNKTHQAQCLNQDCANTPWIAGDTPAGYKRTGYQEVYHGTYGDSELPQVSFTEYMYNADGSETITNAYSPYSASNLTGADARTSGNRRTHFGTASLRGVIATKLAESVRTAATKATR